MFLAVSNTAISKMPVSLHRSLDVSVSLLVVLPVMLPTTRTKKPVDATTPGKPVDATRPGKPVDATRAGKPVDGSAAWDAP